MHNDCGFKPHPNLLNRRAALERQILNQLTAMQVSIISIWSYDWWRDANAETQKLKDAIAECDKSYL